MNSIPSPPFKIVAINGEPQSDAHGNWSAFVKLDNGLSALLRLKGPFPVVGDTITDRVLVEKTSRQGNSYYKLEKPQRGGQGGSQRGSEGPDEAYWEGKNAAIGRAHAQEMCLRYYAIKGQVPAQFSELTAAIDWFQQDAENSRNQAEQAARQPAQQANGTPPTDVPVTPPVPAGSFDDSDVPF